MVTGRVYVSVPSHSGRVQSGSWQCSKRFLAIAPVQGGIIPEFQGRNCAAGSVSQCNLRSAMALRISRIVSISAAV